MESSFLHYIRFGEIGPLKLGMSRAEVHSKMGVPQRWVGHPPTTTAGNIFAPIIHSAENSELWYYYGDAVKIGFEGLEETAISNSINIWPENINNKEVPFLDWPIGSRSTMRQLRDYLIKTDITWYASPDDEKAVYSLLINDNCYATSSIVRKGKAFLQLDRLIGHIDFVADRKQLPRFIRHLLPRELHGSCTLPPSKRILKTKEEQIQAFLRGDFGNWARQQLGDPKDIDNKKFSDFFNVTEEEIWQYAQENGSGTILSDEAFRVRAGSDPKVVEKFKKEQLHNIFKMVKMNFDDRYYRAHQELDLPDPNEMS